jgi:hypothetical protein
MCLGGPTNRGLKEQAAVSAPLQQPSGGEGLGGVRFGQEDAQGFWVLTQDKEQTALGNPNK